MGLMNGLKRTFTGFNVNNTDTVSVWMKVPKDFGYTYYLDHNTGTHVTHEIIIEGSPDGSFDGNLLTNSSLTGLGKLSGSNITLYSYIRFKCKTAEGSPSTIDIIIETFRNT